MNLRDLIFSQPEDPSRQSQHCPLPLNQSTNDATTSLKEVQSLPDSQKDDKSFISNNRRKVKFASALPQLPRKDLAIYGNSPEVRYQIHMKNMGTQRPAHAPGYHLFSRFPRENLPFVSFQKDVIRSIWNTCFFSKDFEGAAMALGVLAEIDSISIADIKASAQMLRYSTTASASINKLIQGMLKPLTRNNERKHAAIGISVELLLSQGNIKAARNLLQNNIVELAHTGKMQYLLAFDSIVIAGHVINVANEIGMSGLGIARHQSLIPDILQIVKDPIEFAKCVKIVHSVSTAMLQCDNQSVLSRRQECRQLLQDLKISLTRSTATTPSLSSPPISYSANNISISMDLHALYVGYLHGSGHAKLALRYLNNLEHNLLSMTGSPPDNEVNNNGGYDDDTDIPIHNITALPCYYYYKLLCKYLVRYHFNYDDDDDGTTVATDSDTKNRCNYKVYRRIVQCLSHWSHYETCSSMRSSNSSVCSSNALPSSNSLFTAALLYKIAAINKESFLVRLCDMIESCPAAAGSQQQQQIISNGLGAKTLSSVLVVSSIYHSIHYVLWKLLANTLCGERENNDNNDNNNNSSNNNNNSSNSSNQEDANNSNNSCVVSISEEKYKILLPGKGYLFASPLISDESYIHEAKTYIDNQTFTNVTDNNATVNTNQKNTTPPLLADRLWWLTSILCPDQLQLVADALLPNTPSKSRNTASTATDYIRSINSNNIEALSSVLHLDGYFNKLNADHQQSKLDNNINKVNINIEPISSPAPDSSCVLLSSCNHFHKWCIDAQTFQSHVMQTSTTTADGGDDDDDDHSNNSVVNSDEEEDDHQARDDDGEVEEVSSNCNVNDDIIDRNENKEDASHAEDPHNDNTALGNNTADSSNVNNNGANINSSKIQRQLKQYKNEILSIAVQYNSCATGGSTTTLPEFADNYIHMNVISDAIELETNSHRQNQYHSNTVNEGFCMSCFPSSHHKYNTGRKRQQTSTGKIKDDNIDELGNGRTEAHIVLGGRVLEILSFQVVVANYLYSLSSSSSSSQYNNKYALDAVQVLLFHALQCSASELVARRCLAYILRMGCSRLLHTAAVIYDRNRASIANKRKKNKQATTWLEPETARRYEIPPILSTLQGSLRHSYEPM